MWILKGKLRFRTRSIAFNKVRSLRGRTMRFEKTQDLHQRTLRGIVVAILVRRPFNSPIFGPA
jgi:hypothetical protein